MMNLYDSQREEEMINNLKSMEVLPPDGLWDDIESTLKVKSRRRKILFSSWASAATVALLFTIGGIYSTHQSAQVLTSNNQNVKSEPIIENKVSATQKLNSSKTDSNRTIFKAESSHEEKIIIGSSIRSTELISQDVDKAIILPERLLAIGPSLNLFESAKPIRIQIRNNSNRTNFGQSLAIAAPSENRTKGNWYFSASGFPIYSFHSAGVMNKAETKQQSGIISWGGSISARYALPNKISIETGLSYGLMGQQEKGLYVVYSDSRNVEIYNNSGFKNNYGALVVSNPDYKVMDLGIVNTLTYDAVNESNFKEVTVSQTFRYLEIPLQISKGFYYKGFNLYIKGGISAGLLVQNMLDLRGSNIHLKGKTAGVDQFIASALTSVGVSIPISKKANLLIEPSFKLGLKSFSKTNDKSYPFSSYIKFGIEIPI